MNFTMFNANTTNLFPAANTTQGGQLCTEFNLRSIDSVDTNPDIKYMLGHSFVHSQDDFSISHDQSKGDSILTISPGRAVINGHYVESLTPMDIDIAEGNSREKTRGNSVVRGELVVGLRMFYAENTTLIGDLDNEGNYIGVQIVVLPPSQFVLPGVGDDCKNKNLDLVERSKTDPDVVTAHLKLGSFTYDGAGMISPDSVKQNPTKTQYFDITRVLNLDGQMDGDYFSRHGLIANQMYAVAGKHVAGGENGQAKLGSAEFCQVTDSMMIWDSNPREFGKVTSPSAADTPEMIASRELRNYMEQTAHKSAHFRAATDDRVELFIPHKQPDNDNSRDVKDHDYKPAQLSLPTANLMKGTPGIVGKTYSKQVINILHKLNEVYHMPNGKQIAYKAEIKDRKEDLPAIPKTAKVGDYVIVGQDYTIDSDEVNAELLSLPATMYVVLPGNVTSIKPFTDATSTGQTDLWKSGKNSLDAGTKMMQAGESLKKVSDSSDTVRAGSQLIDAGDALKKSGEAQSSFSYQDLSVPLGIELASVEVDEQPVTGTSDAEVEKYHEYFGIRQQGYRGEPGKDYFTAHYGENYSSSQYYSVNTAGPYEWSEPIIVTQQIPLAQPERIGGFLNIPDESGYNDNGYVGLDDEGHLRVLDYELLRSGLLAYSLSSDQEFTGLTPAELQAELDEFVNNRIVFPADEVHQEHSRFINLTIELQNTTDGGTVEIRGLDSRFNTSVYLHIVGDATNNTTLRIIDCEKIMIDSNIAPDAKIELYRSCIWYDAYIMNRLDKIKDISFWYERFSDNDPNLIVDGMTVREVGAVIEAETIDYFSTDNSNDNHYQYALQSLTFDSDGIVVGLGIYIRDVTTRANMPSGKHIITATFNLPQGAGLTYPVTRFLKPLKVSGTFTSAYVPTNSAVFEVYVANIAFSLVTNIYVADADFIQNSVTGQITLYDDSCVIDSIDGNGQVYDEDGHPTIPGIEVSEFHMFEGGLIG